MKSSSFDTTSLEAELRTRVCGEVRFDNGSRALYATDGSNYRQVPIGVVVPQDINDVIETVAACHLFDVQVLPRGGGTSLAGQCCNVAVVLDMSKYVNHVLEIDPYENWHAYSRGRCSTRYPMLLKRSPAKDFDECRKLHNWISRAFIHPYPSTKLNGTIFSL